MLESGFRTANVVREGKGRETKQPRVNARHLKQVPERKSDVRDYQWIAQLLQYGLLKGSFIPHRSKRELRDLLMVQVCLAPGRNAGAPCCNEPPIP
jgi:hypothetical protein